MAGLTIEDITGAVLRGDVDADLDKVYQAYRERSKLARAVRSAQNSILLNKGVKVRIINIRPAALKGLTGTIDSMQSRSTFNVKLDEKPLVPIRGVMDGMVYGIPAVCLEKIG